MRENEIFAEEVRAILPKEFEGYFKDTETKHFDPEKGAGSLFTEAKSMPELLEMAAAQRGGLSGDDREKLIEMGVDEKSLLPMCRYLKVATKGEVGIIKLTDLEPGTKVKIERVKQGVPCSLVVESKNFVPVEFGTIIIGPNEKQKPEDPEPSTKEMVWTVHPGLPVRPISEDAWTEGSEVPAGEVKKYFEEKGISPDAIYINLKKVEGSK